MGILTIPPREIYPNKPRAASYANTLSNGVYGTVLDITSGRGTVDLMHVHTADYKSNGVMSISNLNFRVTVDGVQSTVAGVYPTVPALVYDNTVGNWYISFMLTNQLYFYRTLKVEVMQNYSGSAITMYSTVQYSLE